MHFEILCEISDIETLPELLASGRSLDCAESTEEAVGANAKALPAFGWPMAQFI
jgi:hypothetical protein